MSNVIVFPRDNKLIKAIELEAEWDEDWNNQINRYAYLYQYLKPHDKDYFERLYSMNLERYEKNPRNFMEEMGMYRGFELDKLKYWLDVKDIKNIILVFTCNQYLVEKNYPSK